MKTDLKQYQGKIAGIFFVLVFGLRFLYEFLKENQEAFEDGMALNMGQILSIPFIIIGLIMAFDIGKKLK